MKKVGLKDIAEHVGVSIALVSYVLNGQAEIKQVSKENAQKIKAAAELLNYRPNQIAKSLKMHKTHTIGLVVADINYRFSTGITRAIEAEAKKANYTVLFGSSNENENTFAELVNVLINRQVDGLILVPVENSQDQIKMLQKAEIPFVLIDRNFPEITTNHIALDNYKAAYTATAYLIKQGHNRIAFFNYATTMFHLQERDRGYLAALKDHDIVFKSDWLQQINSANRAGDIQQALDSILNLKEPCDAVFFATDTLAINGLKYLNKIKAKVPQDISVLSFDESEAFELFYSPITHLRQPLEEMGQKAVDTLLELINYNKISKQISLSSELIIGQSCKE
ncbi:MAG: LacI family DNA-binding transcriptional regulator [Mucilaginibacter sp.]|uniref:LacI family DNA-binding transcriptional regulator n=1 Tax=Mucilaginibacter sp. TaxID=1882438 RepID=UPI002615F804|nr:substrate-binding domain-containing protein [Mucilaginibacter sp.]MDB5002261.1 LacI family DNA-binding transcriptional regulator [Mucilaginibacter sp.]